MTINRRDMLKTIAAATPPLAAAASIIPHDAEAALDRMFNDFSVFAIPGWGILEIDGKSSWAENGFRYVILTNRAPAFVARFGMPYNIHYRTHSSDLARALSIARRASGRLWWRPDPNGWRLIPVIKA